MSVIILLVYDKQKHLALKFIQQHYKIEKIGCLVQHSHSFKSAGVKFYWVFNLFLGYSFLGSLKFTVHLDAFLKVLLLLINAAILHEKSLRFTQSRVFVSNNSCINDIPYILMFWFQIIIMLQITIKFDINPWHIYFVEFVI